MPFEIKRFKNGCKVADIKTHREFSKNPLPCNIAIKQRVALALSESRKTGKPASAFFK